jgi:hypothetical protein
MEVISGSPYQEGGVSEMIIVNWEKGRMKPIKDPLYAPNLFK